MPESHVPIACPQCGEDVFKVLRDADTGQVDFDAVSCPACGQALDAKALLELPGAAESFESFKKTLGRAARNLGKRR